MDVCSILAQIGDVVDYIVRTLTSLFTSWAFVVFAIFWMLKKHLVTILQKITHDLRIKDNKFSMGEPAQPDVGISSENTLSNIPTSAAKKQRKRNKGLDLPALPDNGLKEYTLEIENDVKKKLDESPYNREKIIVRDSTNYRIATEFERIYRIIFGSQMRLLRNLDNSKQLSKKETMKFFKQEKRRMPDSDIEFAPWIHFLVSQGLIENRAEEYLITNKGRAFMAYVALLNYEDRLW
jgi:hypothetical protein